MIVNRSGPATACERKERLGRFQAGGLTGGAADPLALHRDPLVGPEDEAGGVPHPPGDVWDLEDGGRLDAAVAGERDLRRDAQRMAGAVDREAAGEGHLGGLPGVARKALGAIDLPDDLAVPARL